MTGAGGDGGAEEGLARWLAPTQTSPIDRVPVAEMHEGWAPERVDELSIEATVAVIRSVGVVDPVLLRPRQEGGYEIVAGHRTVAAARLAGLDRVPSVVRTLDDGAALMALALDGTATGRLTTAAAAELRLRMHAVGVPDEDIEDVMAAIAVADPAAAVAAPTAAALEAEPLALEAEPLTLEAEPLTLEAEPLALEAEPLTLEAAVAAAGVPEAPGDQSRRPSRWVPLPAGRPRLARLSSAFADGPRMLRLLAADAFTGTVEMAGADGRRDTVTFLDGACIAVTVEEAGTRVTKPVRLPAPDRGPTVEITVRPHPAAVVIALALALRSPARLVGLDASFVSLSGLLLTLSRGGGDAAVVVSAPRGAGVILISGGEPIAAYARREGEEPGEVAETTDVTAVADLLAGGQGEVDVHGGPLVAPLDLDEVIRSAMAQDGAVTPGLTSRPG